MRDRIIESATNAIERFGFRGFTMDDIARDLGISKKTLYKNFRSKTELFEAAIVKWIEFEKNQTLENLENAVTWEQKMASVMTIYSHRQMPIRLLKEVNYYYPDFKALVYDLSSYKLDIHRQILLDARAAGELNEDLDIEVLLIIIDGIVMNLAEEASRQDRDFQVSTLIDTAQQMLLHGILKHPRKQEESAR